MSLSVISILSSSAFSISAKGTVAVIAARLVIVNPDAGGGAFTASGILASTADGGAGGVAGAESRAAAPRRAGAGRIGATAAFFGSGPDS